jgi:hypothetical protein
MNISFMSTWTTIIMHDIIYYDTWIISLIFYYNFFSTFIKYMNVFLENMQILVLEFIFTTGKTV